jgi:hypothetical protein
MVGFPVKEMESICYRVFYCPAFERIEEHHPICFFFFAAAPLSRWSITQSEYWKEGRKENGVGFGIDLESDLFGLTAAATAAVKIFTVNAQRTHTISIKRGPTGINEMEIGRRQSGHERRQYFRLNLIVFALRPWSRE